MPYDFFSWNVGSKPTARAVDGHAVRTFEQAAALSVCQPASSGVNPRDAGHPKSEKNEQ
jgi:hypothetical protein